MLSLSHARGMCNSIKREREGSSYWRSKIRWGETWNKSPPLPLSLYPLAGISDESKSRGGGWLYIRDWTNSAMLPSNINGF